MHDMIVIHALCLLSSLWDELLLVTGIDSAGFSFALGVISTCVVGATCVGALDVRSTAAGASVVTSVAAADDDDTGVNDGALLLLLVVAKGDELGIADAINPGACVEF